MSPVSKKKAGITRAFAHTFALKTTLSHMSFEHLKIPSDVTLLSPAGLLINRHLMDPSEMTVLLLPTRDIDFVVNLNCSRERLLQSARHG